MNFDLIYNHKILFCLERKTIEEACNFIKKQISGEGEWKNLKGLDPVKCELRFQKITNEYYDLNGSLIDEEKIS